PPAPRLTPSRDRGARQNTDHRYDRQADQPLRRHRLADKLIAVRIVVDPRDPGRVDRVRSDGDGCGEDEQQEEDRVGLRTRRGSSVASRQATHGVRYTEAERPANTELHEELSESRAGAARKEEAA